MNGDANLNNVCRIREGIDNGTAAPWAHPVQAMLVLANVFSYLKVDSSLKLIRT